MVEEQRGLCVLCGEPMAGKHPQPSAPSRDHLWPMLFGGPHAVWNEAAAHAECNGDREEAVTTVVEQVLVDRVGRAAVDGMYEHTQRVFGLDMRWHTEYLAGVQAAEAANRASHELTQDDDGGNRRMCLRCGAAGRFTYERPCEGR